MRQSLFRIIRQFNLFLFLRPLPKRIALYFHALEKSDFDAFSALIGYFAELGYKFCDSESFLAEDNSKKIYLSFDDNYQSWHQALPLLQKLNIKTTFYVNTLPFRDSASPADIKSYYDRLKHGGNRSPLSHNELWDILSDGHTVGSHTHSHFMLTALSIEKAKEEIAVGKDVLEQISGLQVLHFSYPFGMRRHFSNELRNYCSEIGFRTIANAIPCLQYATQSCLSINRSPWRFDRPLKYNVMNIRIDGRLFESVTGRSAAG